MALGASLLVFTTLWAYQGPANYPIAETVRVGYAELRTTIEFDVGPNDSPFAFSFNIWHPGDVILDMNMPGIVWNRGQIDSTGPGFLYEYIIDVNLPTGLHNQDVIVSDPNGLVTPEYRQGKGIVMAPRTDPNYDYALARLDPVAYQKAKKHQHRWEYINGLAITLNPRF
jgi:hypothetical protein